MRTSPCHSLLLLFAHAQTSVRIPAWPAKIRACYSCGGGWVIKNRIRVPALFLLEEIAQDGNIVLHELIDFADARFGIVNDLLVQRIDLRVLRGQCIN